MTDPQPGLEPVLTAAPVVPVVIVDDLKNAVPMAKALVAGGLTAIEVTLRTSAAMEAIKAIAAEVEGANVGVGTVLTGQQLEAAMKAGATFAVSPGATEKLLDAAADLPIPLLPATATVSEMMALIERGYRFAKFFPAEPAGGAKYISALYSPIPQLRFCPTGGVTPESAKVYLKLPNIVCVGGSWMLPKDKIAAGDWAGITALAREAAALRG